MTVKGNPATLLFGSLFRPIPICPATGRRADRGTVQRVFRNGGRTEARDRRKGKIRKTRLRFSSPQASDLSAGVVGDNPCSVGPGGRFLSAPFPQCRRISPPARHSRTVGRTPANEHVPANLSRSRTSSSRLPKFRRNRTGERPVPYARNPVRLLRPEPSATENRETGRSVLLNSIKSRYVRNAVRPRQLRRLRLFRSPSGGHKAAREPDGVAALFEPVLPDKTFFF